MIIVDSNVKNQKSSPALYSDILANIPAAGQTGRLFFATDTNAIYRDTGTAWVVFIGGGATGTYVTIAGSQTITGAKTFTDTIKLIDINNSKSITFNMNQFGTGDLFITNQANTTILTLSNTGSLSIGTGESFYGIVGSAIQYFAGYFNSLFNATDLINTGAIGIGSTPVGSNANLHIDKLNTGALTRYGVNNQGLIASDVTTSMDYYQSTSSTQAAAFTITNVRHFQAIQGTFGAGSTVTNQYGFVAGSTLIGATNNFGFYSNIASGTNRWNFYANGTALNYFNGTTLIGSTTDNGTTAKLQVTGAISFQNTFNRRTASYTLVLTDQNKIVEMNVATANNLSVPTNASVAFPIGTEIAITQYGAGKTTVVAISGVTIRSAGGLLSLSAQYASATLVKVGNNEWYLIGSLIA